MIGRGSLIAHAAALALMGGGSQPRVRIDPDRTEPQKMAKPTSKRQALLQEKALRRRARWDKQE